MRQWKKFMLVLMCAGVMTGVTACGNNTDDNAANDNAATEGTTGNQTDDVTDRNDTNDGVMDEIGDDVRDGADEIGDDVRDGVDDIGDEVDPDDNVNNTTRNTR